MVLEQHEFNLRKRLLYLFTGKIYVAGGIIGEQDTEPGIELVPKTPPPPRRKEIRFITPMKLPCEHMNTRGHGSMTLYCVDCGSILYDG